MAHFKTVGDQAFTNNTVPRLCANIYPSINSDGAFASKRLLDSALPRLELLVFAVFFISHALHSVLKIFGIPILVSQILAGIVMGSTGLRHLSDYGRIMFMIDSDEMLGSIAGLGFQLYIFLSGVKMDLRPMGLSGKKAFYFGALSTVIPLLVGVPTMLKLSKHWGLDSKSQMALFFAIIVQSVTTFPAVCSFISDLKLFTSELGRIGLSSASVSQIVMLILALCCFFKGIAYINVAAAVWSVMSTIIFSAMVLWFGRPAMTWVIKQTPQGRHIKDFYIEIIIIGALVSGLITDVFGVYVAFGSYAIGVAVPTGPPLASALVEKLECIVSGLLIPLLVSLCTMRVDLLAIKFEDNLTKSTAIVIVVVIFAKFFACFVPAFYCKIPKKDSLAFALIMSSKGIIEIVAYAYLRELSDHTGITSGMFSFLVVTILVTTITFSILVNWLYDPSRKYAGYQKRNIMYGKELRILACISQPDNINSTINFLHVSCSANESPIIVDVLHLIKLSGRATPLFISHKMQRKTLSDHSFSEDVVHFFNCFRRNNTEIASIDIFTAISPPKFMHEDICTLALDKATSFILLPFHKKWLPDGSPIELEDINLRALNRSILERAPCSVGILIDRGHLGTNSWESSKGPSLQVAMIFLGGSDDREALVLAKRMSHHRNISLTIIHFVASDSDGETDVETLLDSMALRDVMSNDMALKHLIYEEVMVTDGLEITMIIQSLVKNYNFIIVGRRKGIEKPHISGLGEFIEYPELGVVGSLVTSMQIAERYSVLVVQQQQIV